MKFMKFALVLTMAVYITGCASGAKMENMVYKGGLNTYSEELNKGVEVSNVSGGQKTNPLWTSEISNESFSSAVKDSLLAQGLLSEDGRYKLTIQMLKVDQPLFGLNFEVTTHVKYMLVDSNTRTVVFEETIIAPHTATFDDAFVAIKRLRLANEGSGRKNIKIFLDKLSALQIDKTQISLSQ